MATGTARPLPRFSPVPLPAVHLDHLWRIVPLAFVFVYASAIPLTHTDFYYHLLLGRLMFEQGGWLTREIVTYAPSREPLLNLPWLSQAVYYTLVRLGGFELVSFWHALLVLVANVGVQRLAVRLGAGRRMAAAAVLLGLALAATNLAVRPQSTALPLFVGLLWALEVAPSRRLPIIAAAIAALWVNVHGSFVLAPLLVGAYLVGESIERRSWRSARVRALSLSLLICSAATLVNPLGPAAYRYALAVTDNPTIRSAILEWQPPTPTTLLGALFFASLPLAAIGLWLGRRRLRPAHLLLLGGLLVLALSAQRNVLWWALAMPPIVAGYLGTWILSFGLAPTGAPESRTLHQTSRIVLPFLNACLLVLVIMIALAGLPWLKQSNPLLAPTLRTVLDPKRPEGVAAFFERERLHGRLIAHMEWGGYLAWRLWPAVQPFLDARIEQHPTAVWEAYFAIMSAQPGWSELVDAYGADYVAVNPVDTPRLARALASSVRWRELYRDQEAVVFGRIGAGN